MRSSEVKHGEANSPRGVRSPPQARSAFERRFKSIWPLAPTTGWDHWIRTVTDDSGLECLHPEVPRVKHAATSGSTNVRGSEASALEQFAFAGEHSDVHTFTLDDDEAQLRQRVADAPRLSSLDTAALNAIPPGQSRVVVVALPEDHARLSKLLNLWHTEPRGYSKDGLLVLRRQRDVPFSVPTGPPLSGR